jgi:hypothetical protein
MRPLKSRLILLLKCEVFAYAVGAVSRLIELKKWPDSTEHVTPHPALQHVVDTGKIQLIDVSFVTYAAAVEELLARGPVSFYVNRFTLTWGSVGFGLMHLFNLPSRIKRGQNADRAAFDAGTQVISSIAKGYALSQAAAGCGIRGLLFTSTWHALSNLLVLHLSTISHSNPTIV